MKTPNKKSIKHSPNHLEEANPPDEEILHWNDPPTRQRIEDLVRRACERDYDALVELTLIMGPLLLGAAHAGLGPRWHNEAPQALAQFYRSLIDGDIAYEPDQRGAVHWMCKAVQASARDERLLHELLDHKRELRWESGRP